MTIDDCSLLGIKSQVQIQYKNAYATGQSAAASSEY